MTHKKRKGGESWEIYTAKQKLQLTNKRSSSKNDEPPRKKRKAEAGTVENDGKINWKIKR